MKNCASPRYLRSVLSRIEMDALFGPFRCKTGRMLCILKLLMSRSTRKTKRIDVFS